MMGRQAAPQNYTMNSLWIDVRHAEVVGSRLLEGFHVQTRNPFRANFRCPHCGDSKTNVNKRRGFFIESLKRDRLMMICHNCGYAAPFGVSLKNLDPTLHSEYVIDRIREYGSTRPVDPPKSTEVIEAARYRQTFKTDMSRFSKSRTEAFFASRPGITKISRLPVDHEVRRYVDSRLIPKSEHHRLYATDNFKRWVRTHIDVGSFKSENDGPRLVLPLVDRDGRVFGVTGRSMPSAPPGCIKYLNKIFDDEVPRVFGADRIDISKDVFIVEGPIDSLFVANSVASMGVGHSRAITSGIVPADRAIFVFDNEPRNPDIVEALLTAISDGHRVVIWPNSIGNHKDINSMVMGGLTIDEVRSIMLDSVRHSLAARIAFAAWRRC